ncbi:MAG: DUF1648 domain-containing protein [Candidatus Omnitrophica bacterium]|nr:DUF1648 domain-containing protein [Candidatus Omnitrophota bacterium]
MKLILKWLWLFLLVFIILQPILSYKSLPDKIAVYFNLFGEPNLWVKKTLFFIILYLIIGITNIATASIPSLLKNAPNWMTWFIPNKDYWLSSLENKNECIEIISITLRVVSLFINLILYLLYQCILEFNIICVIYTPLKLIPALELMTLLFLLFYPMLKLRKPKEAKYIWKG